MKDIYDRLISLSVCAAIIIVSPGLECYALGGKITGDIISERTLIPVSQMGTHSAGLDEVPGGLSLGVLPIDFSLNPNSGIEVVPDLQPGFGVNEVIHPAEIQRNSAVAIGPNSSFTNTSAILNSDAQPAPLLNPKRAGAPLIEAGHRSEQAVGPAVARQTPRGLSIARSLDRSMNGGRGSGDFQSDLDSVFDAANTLVYFLKMGHEPVSIPLNEMEGFFAENGHLSSALTNNPARFRMVLSKNPEQGELAEQDLPDVRRNLVSAGFSEKNVRKIDVEKVKGPEKRGTASSTWQRYVSDPILFVFGKLDAGLARVHDLADAQSPALKYPLKIVISPFREFFYLTNALLASMTTPTKSEITAGVIFKIIPTMGALGGLWVLYRGHTLGFITIVTLQMVVDLFYGVFVKSWANFLDRMVKERSMSYMTAFNVVFGQTIMAAFRIVSWLSLHNSSHHIDPPWSLVYWRDMGLITVIGTVIGCLAYPGLLKLYNEGHLSRWWLSMILQLRDLKMAISGVLWGAGLMFWYWFVFGAQQVLDVGFFSASLVKEPRWTTIIVHRSVAETDEFQNLYLNPVRPKDQTEAPVYKKAWQTLISIPLLAPFIWFFKLLAKLFALVFNSLRRR